MFRQEKELMFQYVDKLVATNFHNIDVAGEMRQPANRTYIRFKSVIIIYSFKGSGFLNWKKKPL